MPVAPGTSMPLATWVSAEMDMSFKSDRLKTSSLPSLLTGVSCASAVATPPPLSPLPPLFVRLLFAILFLFMRSRFTASSYFRFLSVDFKYAGQREVPRGVLEKLVWGLLAALISRSCQPVRHRSESRVRSSEVGCRLTGI